MIEYDPDLVEQVAHILDLRTPNQAALDALAKALDGAHDGVELVADLATGVGKTYIAAGLLDYLYEAGVRNVVIVTPGSTIQKKTINNLTPGHPKYVRGLQSKPTVITLDTLERGEAAQALEDPDRFKVFVFTVQSLLRPTSNEGRRAHRPHETVGQALSAYLAAADDLVVIADEHHVYYSSGAKKFRQAIGDLRPAAMIGLTATPHEASEDQIVYRYPLSEAIADGYVKIPVLVTREDGKKDWHTQLGDGINLLNVKVAAMRSYATQTKQAFVEPVLFVVATNIDEANQFRDALAGKDMLDGEEKVLLITSEEPDKTLALLDTLEDPASPIRAVVSVDMLKEGWDVKNIYVIAAPSRALSSGLLTEQILGRGLRLPFGKRTGNPMLDTVEVLSHNSFATLMKDAEVLLSQTLANRAKDTTMVVNPKPGVRQEGVPATASATAEVDTSSASLVEFRVAPANPNQGLLGEDDDDWTEAWGTGEVDPAPEGQVGLQIATIASRLGNDELVETHTYQARVVGGVKIPLWLPKVTIRWERDPFSMSQLDLGAVESLGRQFAQDNAPTLTRKSVDARRTGGKVEFVIGDAGEAVYASTELMDFSGIENDLVQRLMLSDTITQSVSEANATLAVARAFLEGADVTEDTPWREEHGRLATNRLVEWINSKRTSSALREVREVHQVKWPDPPARVEARPPASRHLVTSRDQFERYYPYAGWSRSVYDVNAFDAYSTEFRLATLFEGPGASAVASWARIDNTVPLRINYLMGAIQHEYMPDFLVVDTSGTYWIVEGKADDEMLNPKVLAKRDAAIVWVRTVNDSDDVHQKWAYILASETAIKNAPSWEALKAGAQTFQ